MKKGPPSRAFFHGEMDGSQYHDPMRTLPAPVAKALPLLLAIAAGILLGLPRALPMLAPLQIVGFAAFFLLAHGCKRLRDGVKFGALAGLMAAISALILVHVHFAAALALLLSISFNYALFGGLLLWFLRRGALPSFVAGAGVITLGEWGAAHLFPIFGSAQYTTCPWSDWPGLVRHEAVIGSGGTLFLVALLGAGLAGAVLRKDRGRAMGVLMITGALGAGLGSYARFRVPTHGSGGTLRVAAVIGPAYASPLAAETAYAPLIAEAAKQGAQLVVLPEMAVRGNGTEGTVRVFGDLAKTHRISLVVGLLDHGPGRAVNCALAFGPDGALLATHIKAHHIPFMEHYTRKGDVTAPSLARAPERPPIGLLICQDDNFTDLTNTTVKAGARILAVPTLDWAGVEIAHFTNSRHRALETGTGLVRAAHGGIAAIFAPNGTVLAQRDHLTQGDGIIVADLPLAGAPTPFVRFGDWPLLVLAALAAIGGLMMGHPLKMSTPPPNTA